MPQYVYRCPVCRTSSRPYSSAGRADDRGQVHRDEHHHGDHPDGERIEQIQHAMPEPGQMAALAFVTALILFALLLKII
ncbi:hypothetical protein [Streptomyces sp. NPDC046978]|uniref:hypothetical protein n=1 Tax=Streptomyces sp. NPDC046978 TaxID=3154704 RepID=UPI0033CFEF0A